MGAGNDICRLHSQAGGIADVVSAAENQQALAVCLVRDAPDAHLQFVLESGGKAGLDPVALLQVGDLVRFHGGGIVPVRGGDQLTDCLLYTSRCV